MLEALLRTNNDELCLKYMGFYKRFLDQTLFLFALENSNHAFMRGALLAGAFDKSIFTSEEVVLKMITYMYDGSKTNYILNVLLLTDVILWKNRYLQ
jgi:hypothetical protein